MEDNNIKEEEKVNEADIQSKEDFLEHEDSCSCENNCDCSCCSVRKKRVKNLFSALILAIGLLFGSLFVDLSQLIKGSGFSQKNLNKTDIFEAGEKTWVAYSEPAVTVKVVSDENCAECDPAEVLVWLRRVSPTISAEKINFDSEEGKNLIEKFSLKTLPAFIFSNSVTKTEFYAQAQMIFSEKENQYELNIQELGLAPGKYLEIPAINENDATFGNKDAEVKIIVFSDFECPYCKAFYQSMRKIMGEYKDKTFFVLKDFPLDFHSQAESAALAANCALEEGKFWEYSDKLFADQTDWQNTTGTQKFKTYAQILGLKSAQFNQCLDNKKYQSKIDDDKNEATNFGISGTPAIFINNKFFNGVVGTDDLKKDIEEELAK